MLHQALTFFGWCTQTRIEVEDFYSTKKGRRMLKVQVADKKKNSHMFTKKQMKKAYVQQEYLDVKTENRVREVRPPTFLSWHYHVVMGGEVFKRVWVSLCFQTRERLTRDFKRDLDKCVLMLILVLRNSASRPDTCPVWRRYEDMLDQILLDYEVDDSEVNEDVRTTPHTDAGGLVPEGCRH